jgi:flagellar hook-basal body complex protein FliE
MAIEAVTAGATGVAGAAGAIDRPSTSRAAGDEGGDGGFAQSLGKLLDTTNTSSADANSAVGRMLDGSGDVHEAMIALQQADMMLQLTVQVRNKLVQAYQDIMRMPV